MAEATKRPGPDLRPWDQALAQRVQPVLSALFHDVMSPLTLLKNRLFLAQRHLHKVAQDPSIPEETKAELGVISELLEGVEASANRIYRGMAIPRDAIWATILEGTPFEPASIVKDISHAMRADPPVPADAAEAEQEASPAVSHTA